MIRVDEAQKMELVIYLYLYNVLIMRIKNRISELSHGGSQRIDKGDLQRVHVSS